MISKISVWLLAAVVTTMYVFSLIGGIGDIIGMNEMIADSTLSITGIGWFLLIFGIALPIMTYALAIFAGRGRSAWVRLLLLATGMCVVALVDLEVGHLINLSGNFNENIFLSN